ncbi:Uncharacterized protein, chloroplastic [Vitis vinifera]|uniref:Uncharacterized protein, chloroplastic n=1 Tax=Vitis vinifera TaxID=29760 RepID=A0A438HJG5_VITVI|nr:Uncharacterized protein, chloroplastic [Vitis vinifera]
MELLATTTSSEEDYSTKLVTFLGKSSSGKTTSAIFAAQHYAMTGFNTCLVIHSQDPTAKYLLNYKIGTSPIICNNNLSTVRLETTKMILEPLHLLKKADVELNITQGVVGEELRVLPGMDSMFTLLALERLVGFLGNLGQRNLQKDNYDIIIYDGINAEETLCMISVTSRARGSNLNGKMSSGIWDILEHALEVSGAFGTTSPHSDVESEEIVNNFSPLPFALCPHVPMASSSSSSNVMEPVKFDPSKKSVSLLMPGDQRRVIHLPPEIQGKVGGVKFADRKLVITMR